MFEAVVVVVVVVAAAAAVVGDHTWAETDDWQG